MTSIARKMPSLGPPSRSHLEAALKQHGTFHMRLGVWEAWSPQKTQMPFRGFGKHAWGELKALWASASYVWRFLVDIYRLGPWLMFTVWSTMILEGSLSGWTMWTTNRLLSTIESGVLSHKIDKDAVQSLLVMNVGLRMLSLCLSWTVKTYQTIIRSRALMHFDEIRMSASLSQSLQTFEDRKSQVENAGNLDGGYIFTQLAHHLSNLVSLLSESVVLYRVARDGNVGSVFTGVAILSMLPLFPDPRHAFWYGGCLAYAVDEAYIRLANLKSICFGDGFRQEILSGDLGSYLIRESSKCRERLRNTLTVDFYRLLDADPNRAGAIVKSLMDDFPTMYYAAHAISGHVPFHFSTMISLQRGLSWLKWRIQATFVFGGESNDSLQAVFSNIKQFYTVMDDIGEPIDDGLAYAPASEPKHGMHIELRDVMFSYPNSQSSQPAVRGISCVLRPGQLVVIVGSNGSAKTTLTKLLTRLYEPTSGTILIDGRSASEYRVRDFRRTTALLAQDHLLFPLPLKENISTGLPHDFVNQFAIQDAAKKGGAHDFISKYDAGYDTVLNPVETKWQRDLPGDHALMKLHNSIEKQVGVSGGERQRLVASRTFMRITDPRIRLVIVDEPSSAMDPEGEYELFKHLREEQRGRTMIFITHRFGHLTKHADLILCLKEGELVESGTHKQLVAKQGEYYNLYNIQAQAFTS